MEFLKRHYEKVLLSLVLLGLAAAAAMLPLKIKKEREDLASKRKGIVKKVKEFKPLDLSQSEAALKRLQTAPAFNFSLPHNLFNPVMWQQRTNGELLKVQTGKEVGPDALQITRIYPLHFILVFKRVAGTSYYLGATRENAPARSQRLERQLLATLNVSNAVFTLRQVKGTPEDPAELIVELADTREKVSVTKANPYKRVEGYAADLKYEPEKQVWTNRFAGETLVFAADTYNIVDISTNGVLLSASSSSKRSFIPYRAAP